jgi:uncharacterized damage-inducible protein DinB
MSQRLNALGQPIGPELPGWLPPPQLEIPVLVSRLLALLDSAARLTEQIPDDALAIELSGRDRSQLGLAYHVTQVVVAFLDSALGGRLTREHFERKPPDHLRTAGDVARLARSVSQALAVWWSANQARLPSTLDTYYGVQPLHAVLEWTVWHVAQHARQLEHLLRQRGITPQPPLAPNLLEGLPLPEDAWDDEVPPT